MQADDGQHGQLCRLDRDHRGHGHQRLGPDLRALDGHLPPHGRAGLPGALGGVRHLPDALPLRDPQPDPQPARPHPDGPGSDDPGLSDGAPWDDAPTHLHALRPAAQRQLGHQEAPSPSGKRPVHPHGCVRRHLHRLVPHRRSPQRGSDVVRLLALRRLGRLRALSAGRHHDAVLPQHRPLVPEQGQQLLLLQAEGHGHSSGPPRQPRQERAGVKKHHHHQCRSRCLS